MFNFNPLTREIFLTDYWQKKPYVFRQALTNTNFSLTPDELAGLALEDNIESRLVTETPNISPYWQLKRGPFTDSDFTKLPKTHWTLLVQGVDRVLPEIAALWDNFSFLPAWRIDDIMISYAVKHGSVGPHYDHYDVFLYQAMGRRKWSLTSSQCHQENIIADLELRLMQQFDIQEEYILEPGDVLYLPPLIGHHGVSLDDSCMTCSFGYREYKGQELLESFTDFLAEKDQKTISYVDPNWHKLNSSAEISSEAIQCAKNALTQSLSNETSLSEWFGCFATQLDQSAEQQMSLPLDEHDPSQNLSNFLKKLPKLNKLMRDTTCRMAYIQDGQRLFINGCEWPVDGCSNDLIKLIANQRTIYISEILPFLTSTANQQFLHDLWRLQWLFDI